MAQVMDGIKTNYGLGYNLYTYYHNLFWKNE